MAHRKPLGTTCEAHFAKDAWDRIPDCGDVLRSEAGTLYLVAGVIEGRTRNRYVLERIGELPDGEFWLFEFYWLPRERRSPA